MAVKAKKIVSLVFTMMLLSMLALFATGCGGDAKAAGKYIAGTYTGEGRGMGAIEVTLTVDDGAITKVDSIVGDGETPGMGGLEAIEDGTYDAQIMAAQDGEIDGISGATISSQGVENAVKDALEQAANPDYTAA